MKKILLIFLLSFAFISGTKAQTAKFHLGEKVPNMHIESIDGDKKHNGIPFVLTSDTGKIVYCINPFDKLNTSNSYTAYFENNSVFKLTDYQLSRMNLIAYYGYKYKNHNELKWYGVTQFLIWKELNIDDIYFTDTYNGNRIIAYQNEISEIENLVQNYYKLPSFSNNHFYYTINSNYEIVDENNVLNDYDILNSNIDAKIKDNKLIVNTAMDGTYKVDFIKHSPVKDDYILYYLNGAQSLIYPGKFNDITFSITIEVSSGNVTINKTDSENVNRKEATLKGAKYGLYNEYGLVTIVETDDSGLAVIDNLQFGKYYIKEIEPSLGYELDDNIYKFEITKDNKEVHITSLESIIKGKIIINKYYGSSASYSKENGAVFEIYDASNNLVGSYESKDGIINVELPYGNYYVKQVKGIDGYRFVEDFKVFVDESKEYTYDLYDESELLLVSVPNTLKNDYNYYISIIFITLGILFIISSRIKKINL